MGARMGVLRCFRFFLAPAPHILTPALPDQRPEISSMQDARLPVLAELEQKVLWLASWIIHNANHLRESSDGLKTIAEQCGYDNAFYFTRVFVREHGQSPGRFRKSRRV